MKIHSASLSMEDFQRKVEDQKQEEAERNLTPRQQQANEIIRQQLSSFVGRQNLANSFTTFIRRELDNFSMARRVFRVDPLRAGALPVYERTENFPTFTGNTEGLVESLPALLDPVPLPARPLTMWVNAIRRRRISVPLFEITSNPEIPLSQICNNRFDLIDNVQNRAGQAIANSESLFCRNILNAATTHTNQIIRPAEFNSSDSVLNTFRDAFASIERSQLRVARILSNNHDYSIIRNNLRSYLDQTTHNELRESGLMGSLWGAQVITNQNIPSGEIYVTSEPEHLGVMPIRDDITTRSTDDPTRATIGWTIYEGVGMACMNP
ncbi:MAG: hypothetical protein IMZ64_04025, partial [Bacteroidetes bacterium]|nr:hypothetical protein [Bacteroidota bacterium]